MLEGRTAKQKEKLIKALTDAVVNTLKIPEDWVSVIINDVPKINWGLKGKQISKKR